MGLSGIEGAKRPDCFMILEKSALASIPQSKPGSLTAKGSGKIQRWSEVGYHILRSVSEFSAVAEYVLCHHERVDGNGYPRNLKEKEIPVQAKIIALADSYDAMTRDRTYKSLNERRVAIEEIDLEILELSSMKKLPERLLIRC